MKEEKDINFYRTQHTKIVEETTKVIQRSVKEHKQNMKFASGELLLDLLETVDAFDYGRRMRNNQMEVSTTDPYELLYPLHDTLMNTLKKHGLEEISTDGMFNPEIHEVLSQTESVRPRNTIVSVHRKGYTHNGRLLRPALVAVSNNKEK